MEKLLSSVFAKSKAPGIDEIDGQIIKENKDIFALPLSYAIKGALLAGKLFSRPNISNDHISILTEIF